MRAGDLVRGIRREAGLSQAQLAERIGVSQARIAELEAGRGQQGPTWNVMDRVAKACGRELCMVTAPSEVAVEGEWINIKDLSDLIQRSNDEALELLNRRFKEAMDEVKAQVQKAGTAAE